KGQTASSSSQSRTLRDCLTGKINAAAPKTPTYGPARSAPSNSLFGKIGPAIYGPFGISKRSENELEPGTNECRAAILSRPCRHRPPIPFDRFATRSKGLCDRRLDH